jgi:membrane protease YdiL (CAAX protease family)
MDEPVARRRHGSPKQDVEGWNATPATFKMEENNITIRQYSIRKILLIWAAAAVPIGICGWVIAPLLTKFFSNAGIGRIIAITIGLAWQFILTLILLHNEYGKLNFNIIKNGLLLNHPKVPGTDRTNKLLWLLLIPLILLTAFFQIHITKIIINWWTALFPVFKEPALYSMTNYINSIEGRNEITGSWWILIIYVICAIFNTVLGEEFLFRGILLPRMNKVFKKFDWAVNGILFGLYHVHQPWGLVSTIILSSTMFALTAKCFKSTWFSIILHSGQSVFFIVLMFLIISGLGL